MNETYYSDLKKEMDKSIVAFRKELAKLRTGRASTALLESVMVEYYGTQTPLNQLATLGAPEPRLLVVQPYDQGAIGNIEKAILKADLGLVPNNDGKLIRIPIPELTEDRRKDLVRHVKKLAEEFRVSGRNHRRLAIDRLKEMEKNKEITEDELKHTQTRVQKITDDFIVTIEKVLKTKEDEIMEV